MIYTLKDYEYDLNKASDVKSDFYAFVKRMSPEFHRPLFSLKDCQKCICGLTYRKINDWDRKELITGSRVNNKAGWRKFSLVDIVKLFIISDLRKFGMGIENIKSVIRNVSSAYADSDPQGIKKTKFLQLEYFIARSLTKNPIVLLIDESQKVSFFLKKDAIKNHFHFDKAFDPVVILPFFLYVQNFQINKRTSKEKHD